MAGPFYMQGGALPALDGVPTLVTQAEFEECCCDVTYCRITVNYYCKITPYFPYYYTVKPKVHCSPATSSGVPGKGFIWVDPGRYVITHNGSTDKAWSTDLSHTNCGGGPCWSTRHWIEWDQGHEGGLSQIRSFQHFTQPASYQTSAYDAVTYATAYQSTSIEVNKRTQLFFWVDSTDCDNNVGEVTMRLGVSSFKHWRWTTYRPSPPPLQTWRGPTEQSCKDYYHHIYYNDPPLILPPSPLPEYVTCSNPLTRSHYYDTVDEIGVEGWETIQ